MILENVLLPFFNVIYDNEKMINVACYLIVFYLAYIVVKFFCKGVIKWYKWFMIF